MSDHRCVWRDIAERLAESSETLETMRADRNRWIGIASEYKSKLFEQGPPNPGSSLDFLTLVDRLNDALHARHWGES